MSVFRFFVCGLLLLTAVGLGAEERVWTRVFDGKTIEAAFVSQDEDAGTVTVKLKAGKEVTLAVDVLSQDDRDWLEGVASGVGGAGAVGGEKEKPEKLGKMEMVKHSTPEAKVKTWEVYYPAGLAEEERENAPLCVLYSPNKRMDRLMKTMRASADKFGWILVGIDAYSHARVERDYSGTLNDSILVFKDIQKKIPHDKKKVIFSGFSGGAWWSYVSSARVYQKAAGVVAFGGWMSKQYSLDVARKMKVVMINGNEDSCCDWEKPDGDFLTKKRATVKVVHFPAKHRIAPSEVTMEGVEWVHVEAGF